MTGLTTDAVVTGNPESAQADRIYSRAFPPNPQRFVTDVITAAARHFHEADGVVDGAEEDCAEEAQEGNGESAKLEVQGMQVSLQVP